MTESEPGVPRRIEPKSKPKTGVVVLAIALMLAVLLAALAVVAWYVLLLPAKGDAVGKPVQVVISKGSSTALIAKALADSGVVSNALVFRLEAHFMHADGKLKAGVYDLSTGMTYASVVKNLESGPRIVYYEVPIPEGFTAKQIAARFASRAGVSEDEFLALAQGGADEFSADHAYLAGAYNGSLEGYLFPKTYQIKKGTSARQVIEMMLDQFDTEIASVDMSYAKSHGMSTAQVVTLASIIEREVRLSKEYPLVSSVIYNRIAKGMRLQLDSTVFYFLPDGTKTITSADLHNENPYNTYRHAGLPPGPLSNPGLEAIQAAAHPAKTHYYYYVLTGKDGSQTFTTTYQDFLKAVKKYHRVFGK